MFIQLIVSINFISHFFKQIKIKTQTFLLVSIIIILEKLKNLQNIINVKKTENIFNYKSKTFSHKCFFFFYF